MNKLKHTYSTIIYDAFLPDPETIAQHSFYLGLYDNLDENTINKPSHHADGNNHALLASWESLKNLA